MIISEAATKYGVSERTIRRWVDSGRLGSYRLGALWTMAAETHVHPHQLAEVVAGKGKRRARVRHLT